MKVKVIAPGVTSGHSVLDVGVVTGMDDVDAIRLIESGYVEAVEEPEAEPEAEPEVEPEVEPDKKATSRRTTKTK